MRLLRAKSQYGDWRRRLGPGQSRGTEPGEQRHAACDDASSRALRRAIELRPLPAQLLLGPLYDRSVWQASARCPIGRHQLLARPSVGQARLSPVASARAGSLHRSTPIGRRMGLPSPASPRLPQHRLPGPRVSLGGPSRLRAGRAYTRPDASSTATIRMVRGHPGSAERPPNRRPIGTFSLDLDQASMTPER